MRGILVCVVADHFVCSYYHCCVVRFVPLFSNGFKLATHSRDGNWIGLLCEWEIMEPLVKKRLCLDVFSDMGHGFGSKSPEGTRVFFSLCHWVFFGGSFLSRSPIFTGGFLKTPRAMSSTPRWTWKTSSARRRDQRSGWVSRPDHLRSNPVISGDRGDPGDLFWQNSPM